MAEAGAKASGRPGSPSARISGDLARESWRRPWYSQVLSFVVWVLVTVPAIWLCDWILPGFHTGRPAGPVAFAIVMGAIGVVVQPLLVGAAVRLGWLGVLALTLVSPVATASATAGPRS